MNEHEALFLDGPKAWCIDLIADNKRMFLYPQEETPNRFYGRCEYQAYRCSWNPGRFQRFIMKLLKIPHPNDVGVKYPVSEIRYFRHELSDGLNMYVVYSIYDDPELTVSNNFVLEIIREVNLKPFQRNTFESREIY